MDAFAVSISKGLTLKNMEVGKALLCGLWFGVFQALMPLAGFFAGRNFAEAVAGVDHWIVFLLLGAIGGNMIRESLSKDDDSNKVHDGSLNQYPDDSVENEEPSNEGFGFVTMLMLAIATSIDALAVGVSFAFLKVNIWTSVAIIGCTTFIISIAGVKIGNIFGLKFKSKAEFAGGVILVLIGLKVLIEHLVTNS